MRFQDENQGKELLVLLAHTTVYTGVAATSAAIRQITDVFYIFQIIYVTFPFISDKFAAKLSHYDVVIPSLVDSSGGFISHNLQRRYSRAHFDDEDLHMHVPAFGKTFHLHVNRNSGLLGPGFVSESGEKLRQGHPDCHFVGQVKDQPGSHVAISACSGGLVSKINRGLGAWRAIEK